MYKLLRKVLVVIVAILLTAYCSYLQRPDSTASLQELEDATTELNYPTHQ